MILGITTYYIENKIKSLNQGCKAENPVIASVYDNQELIKIFIRLLKSSHAASLINSNYSWLFDCSFADSMLILKDGIRHIRHVKDC